MLLLQSILEFWYEAAFQSPLPDTFVTLQGALKRYHALLDGVISRGRPAPLVKPVAPFYPDSTVGHDMDNEEIDQRPDPNNAGLPAAFGKWGCCLLDVLRCATVCELGCMCVCMCLCLCAHAESAGKALLPPNVTYWYISSLIGHHYSPRLMPRSLNLAPNVWYCPVESITIEAAAATPEAKATTDAIVS